MTSIEQMLREKNIAPSSVPVSGTNYVIGQRPDTYVDMPAAGGGSEAFQDSAFRDVTREILGPVFTLADLQAYVGNLSLEETAALQEGLWVEGFYGVIESQEDLEDTDNFINALGTAAREGSTQYQWGLAEDMEGVPTLDGRFSDRPTQELLDEAKEKYIKEDKLTFAVSPASSINRTVDATWNSVLGRKPTDKERRAAFETVRSAEIENAQAQRAGGMYESLDRTGILSSQAEMGDPGQARGIEMSNTTSLIKQALGLK